jgi:glucan 1,3-beta-glucosidase
VSYAPFKGSQTPFDASLVAPPEQIDADLAVLSQRFRCVRTYAADQGLDHVPAAARRNGMKVLLGAWIGRDEKANARQIDQVVRLARQYPDVVRAVVVGNETLLRGELPASRLIELIGEVRERAGVPVTYADVWEFWSRFPEIAPHVDFLTIHILPYWEDEPVGVEEAAAYNVAVFERVQAKFPGKRLLIGETGWPSAGRRRGEAEPSPVNQARFVREFVRLAEARGRDYNLVEAFDQPWKRYLEGRVGGAWGVFSEKREPKFSFTGPVSNDPHWAGRLAFATLLAAAPLGFAALRRPRWTWLRWLAFGAASFAAGSALVLQTIYFSEAARDLLEWSWGVLLLAATATTAALLLGGAAAGRRLETIPLGAAADWLRHPRRLDWRTGLGLLRAFLLLAATATAFGLIFDPRYRDFPISTFLIPAIGFAVARPAAPDRAELWVSAALAVAAVATAINETFANPYALAWAAACLVYAAPGLRLAAAGRLSPAR